MIEAPITEGEAAAAKEDAGREPFSPVEDSGSTESPLQTPVVEAPKEETPAKEDPSKEAQSKELQSALAQKDHYRTKYEAAEIKLKKAGLGVQETPLPPTNNPMDVVKLSKALEGYNEDEVDFIVRNAPEKSIDGIIDATKDAWVKTAIDSRREKAEGDKKTPSPSSPPSTYAGKSDTDMQKMSTKEFAQFVRGEMGREKGGV